MNLKSTVNAGRGRRIWGVILTCVRSIQGTYTKTSSHASGHCGLLQRFFLESLKKGKLGLAAPQSIRQEGNPLSSLKKMGREQGSEKKKKKNSYGKDCCDVELSTYLSGFEVGFLHISACWIAVLYHDRIHEQVDVLLLGRDARRSSWVEISCFAVWVVS